MENEILTLEAFSHFREFLEEMKKDKPAFDMIDGAEDGGRKSGKTTNVIQFSCIAALMFPNQCDVEAFRWLKGEDADELFEEFVDNMEAILGRELKQREEINWSKRRIWVNGNKITVRGVNNASKRKKVKMVGLKRAKGKKYLIKMFEERYEFSTDEILGINQALGGYQHIIELKLTNPHSLAYSYIKELDTWLPHDRQQLSTKGEQWKLEKTTKEVNGMLQRVWRYAHYTNWRVNNFLSSADIISIQEAAKYSENKAKVADLGMPAVEEGAIYGAEMEKVIIMPRSEMITKYQHTWKSVSVGIDLGNGDKEESSATAMEIVAFDKQGASYYVYEYYQHNKDGYVSNTQKAAIMVQHILDLIKQSPRIQDIVNQDGITLNVDWDNSFQELLETVIIERNVENYFEVQSATKYSELTRIEIRKHKMNTGRYYVASENIGHLKELEIQRWDENKKDKKTGRHEQEDANNHTTDAGDYAEAFQAYEIFEEAQFKLLNKNIKMRGHNR